MAKIFQASRKKKNMMRLPISLNAFGRRFLTNKIGRQIKNDMRQFHGTTFIAKSISGGISVRMIFLSMKFIELENQPLQ
ncbi:MAG TPA: hypothetical protein VHX90_03515 [Verrucomicrobiae bacterium]|nr:hypothetical protein [Verrucomicrobiae bacterium]